MNIIDIKINNGNNSKESYKKNIYKSKENKNCRKKHINYNNKKNVENNNKNNAVRIITKTLKIFSFIAIILWVVLYILNYKIGDEAPVSLDDAVAVTTTAKKDVINALVCGTNDNLTDTILYIHYDVNTGKIAMMSIPRDTYVDNEYCIGHKINSIYRGKNIAPLISQVEKMLDTKIDYYLIFDSSMLIEMVDEIGGIEVDVPLRMKYDDPTQNLHIDLQKGVQVLNGKQAEHFVRYRKGNDGSTYARGDLQRIEVQQEFIKTFIKTVLSVKNIPKLNKIIEIATKNTTTNVTLREALKYVTDISKLDISNITSTTAYGKADYINKLSYFVMDEEKTKQLVRNNLQENQNNM